MKKIVQERYNSIAWLRLIAIFMIVYDHLIGFRNPNYIVNRLIEGILNKPLHIIQSYGAFGVCLFFLISGFLIMTSNQGREKIGLKLIKKVVRIYLSVLVSFISFVIIQWILNKFTSTYWAQFSIIQWIESATLFGYFNGAGDVINGTTWFLIPLFLFYLLGIFIINRTNKNYEKGVIETEGILSLLVIGLFILKKFFSIDFPVTGDAIFVFIPVTGVILFGAFSQKIGIWKAVIFLVYNYLMFLGSIYEFNSDYYTNSPYLISYIYALALFVLFLVGEKHFSPNRIVDFIGKMGLPIYLLHMTWGAQFISILEPHMPFTFAIILTLIFVLVIAWIHDKYIDKTLIKKFIR